MRRGNGGDLARELGITRQAVHAAEKSGRISRTADGKFDLDAAAIQYRMHTHPEQQRRALAKQSAGAVNGTSAPLMFEDWRTRQARADAETAEINLAKLKGTLVERANVVSTARRAGYAIIGALEPIADRVSAECGIDDAQRRKIRHVLTRELDRLRAEVADVLETETQ